jgi:SET domain-containing protein
MNKVRNLNPKLEVKPSTIEGMGVFTREPIKKGEQIVININYQEPEVRNYTDEEFIKFREDCIKNGLEWDSISLGNGMHRAALADRWNHPENFGNHSCDPNMSKDHIALRDIEAGEELTVDYSEYSDINWEMECKCGSKKCRGKVKGKVK